MAHEGVCFERKLLIPDAKPEDVATACRTSFRGMGLKVMKSEKTKEGNMEVLAGERALVPLTLRTLLYPFSLQDYFKAAQRSGVHIVISPSKEGVILYSCGIELDELTGKPSKYPSETTPEEITDTMEALDFEEKFLNRIKVMFPKTKEV